MTLRDLLGRVAGPPKPQPGGLSTDRRHVIRELDLPPADARIHLRLSHKSIVATSPDVKAG
jgi:hypothetical protein